VVRRGEYLERAIVIPTPDDAHLEGLFHRGRRSPGVLIVPPHPFEGGSMESAIISELAWATTRAGHPTLRFNYRGVGASPGTFEESAVPADVDRAAHHLRLCVAGTDDEAGNLPPIAAIGVGFGAGAALDLALRASFSVAPLILVSPDLRRLADVRGHRGELVLVRAQLDPAADLAALEAIAATARDGRVATVPAADAAFVRGLVELGKIVAETLAPPGLVDLGADPG
jgi:hypothetical protein